MTPATVADLQAELDPIEADIKQAELELVELAQQFDDAKAAADAYSSPAWRGVTAEEQDLSIARSTTENALKAKRFRLDQQLALAAPLRAMVTAPVRVLERKASLDEAADHALAAGKAAAKCERTVERVTAQLVEARAVRDERQGEAARELVNAARDDRLAHPMSVDHSVVGALEAAERVAQADLVEAQLVHTTAENERHAALQRLLDAERDVATLELELAMRNFVPVVARYRKAIGRDYWPDDDLRPRVYRAERAGSIA